MFTAYLNVWIWDNCCHFQIGNSMQFVSLLPLWVMCQSSLLSLPFHLTVKGGWQLQWGKWVPMAGCEIKDVWEAPVLYKNSFAAWGSERGLTGLRCQLWEHGSWDRPSGAVLAGAAWSRGPGPSLPLWNPRSSDQMQELCHCFWGLSHLLHFLSFVFCLFLRIL